MEKLIQLAEGMNNRFPEGNDAFQITTRILEECGEDCDENCPNQFFCSCCCTGDFCTF